MKNKRYIILSINYGGHDTSACIMIDGIIVSACEQERFDLNKHSRSFPLEAINECLKISNVQIDEVDEFIIPFDTEYHIKEKYLKPVINKEVTMSFLINDLDRIKKISNIKNLIREKTNFKGPIKTIRHHLAHLASAYYPSGFNKCLLVSHDGIGEIESSVFAIGNEGKITIINDQASRYPDSLGLIYTAITFFLGWKTFCDEGIIMGLAPYGNADEKIPNKEETYYDIFKEIINLDDSYNYKINKDWIYYHIGRDKWVSDKFREYFGAKREYEDEITQHHKNIAAALQKRLEEVVISQLKFLKNKYKCEKVAVAGGVGLNCSMNGKIYRKAGFKEIFVQPASGDAGVPIGACYIASKENENKIDIKKRYNSYLGSRFSDDEIYKTLNLSKESFYKPENLFEKVAKIIANGKIIAWFQGNAEFGPRALGNRSIICRPYSSDMKDYINSRVKFREYFRPFAPAVTLEQANKFFEIDQESPHMLIAVKVRDDKKDLIPAVVHVDNSCRVQTVSELSNQRFYKLLKAFEKETKIPVLLNTSFNVKGQPIVNTPQQAIDCFKSTAIDCLVLGDYILEK
jgi:carbamoyltransferase